MVLRGKLYDGKTSRALDVDVDLRSDGIARISGSNLDGTPIDEAISLRAIKISARIGDTQRRLAFENGSMFETYDNDLLDEWLTELRGHGLEHRVFRLERYWHVTLGALILIALISWLAIRYGVPVAANIAARAISPSVDSKLGSDGLRLLDQAVFEPSKLPTAQQDALRAEFKRMVQEIDHTHQYRLEFRRGKRIGANAFALPSGIVVVTDELVEMADDPREIYAVLGHEIGHVVNRHALRIILQSSASGALIVALFGDFASVSSLISATPILLVQAKYSRELETEADDFAYAWMKKQDIPVHFLGDMLLKLESVHDAKRGSGQAHNDDIDFFASHPRTRDRIRE
jgi:Zn-dependent protease with chaperone function